MSWPSVVCSAASRTWYATCVPSSARAYSTSAMDTTLFGRDRLQGQNQRLGAVATVALSLQGHIELVREGEPGHRDLHPRRLLERDAHVLHEVVDEEAGRVVAREDARREVRQRPARGGAARHRLEHPLDVETGPAGVQQGLADGDDVAGHEGLVDELGVLSGSRGTLEHHGLAHDVEERAHGVEDFGFAADHDRQ